MRVCVPVCAKSLTELEEACARARQYADIVELRLDCLDSVSDIKKLPPSGPMILTFRPSEQGGYRELTRAQREAFWSRDWTFPANSAFDRVADLLVDIEYDLVSTSSLDLSRVIVSHHDFSGVPDDLEKIYEQLAATRARIVKIAVRANDIADCIGVFKLLERAREEKRDVIAIAMGNAGIATRILGPSRGAYLTYGSLEDESATAPGQVNARQLRSVYRIDDIDQDTMICGLVGLPVMHSVSPHMHNAAFAATGVNGVYLPLEVKDIDAFVKRMVHPATREIDWNLRGLSVTAPHKSSVMPLLDWVDAEAQDIGAVNTVVIEKGLLHGYNTDVYGFIEPLRERMGSLKGLRVAVIGAGGASRAVAWALKKDHAEVTVFARDPAKGEPLAGASFPSYDVVINATPVCPVSAEQLAGARLVYDLVYNPIETGFLKEARLAGCETLGGLPMLAAQARRQFELWTGKTPSAELMYDSAAAALRQ